MKRSHLAVMRFIMLTTAVGFATVQVDQKQSGTPDVKSSVQTTGAAAQIPEPKPGPQIERLRQALEGTSSPLRYNHNPTAQRKNIASRPWGKRRC